VVRSQHLKNVCLLKHMSYCFDLIFAADHLPPIFLLVYSWQRLELDSWPLLLEEVQEKYDMDAVKVSFITLIHAYFLFLNFLLTEYSFTCAVMVSIASITYSD